ncbi:GNAT family N-acetyltransferase [Nocardioides sp. C4-1]|uniref:GNAT family N-acetyltransferase n=1 Tax=Nocardioides sp. C4-1 TaxID=3151851 RepID=UPI003264C371
MSRTLVGLRAAELDDAPFLVELWATSLRKAEPTELVADVEQLVKAAADSAEHRIVLAEYDGQPAGAVYLCITTLTPLNLETTVQVLAPCVVAQFRRHGIGRLLMEAAVTFAEEAGVAQVATAVSAGSRDGNRFMARLALGPLATYRTAPTAMVRARLTAQRPLSTATGSGGRHLPRVLAARRSARRSLVD